MNIWVVNQRRGLRTFLHFFDAQGRPITSQVVILQSSICGPEQCASCQRFDPSTPCQPILVPPQSTELPRTIGGDNQICFHDFTTAEDERRFVNIIFVHFARQPDLHIQLNRLLVQDLVQMGSMRYIVRRSVPVLGLRVEPCVADDFSCFPSPPEQARRRHGDLAQRCFEAP